jgi:hypothetical protein
MSGLKAFESIRGTISGESTLSGTLSAATGQDYDIYSGEYEIIPDVEDEQTLETAHKLLTDNIVVAKVPYFETSNDSNGNTAYIGKEV